MNVRIYIDGVRTRSLELRWIRASYVRPWEAGLAWAGRHDGDAPCALWDAVVIQTTAGIPIFRGNITSVAPGGLAQEGVDFIASDRRFRLLHTPVRINGHTHYVWNRRGHTCHDGQGGEDSPGKDGGKWTAGEVIVDALEHALDLPAGGSDIAGHHSDGSCVTETYLTDEDIAGYSAADILALDSVLGEFSTDNTNWDDFLSELLALNGNFYGWFIAPATGNLVVVEMDELPIAELEAGELGHWQDEAGTDYVLLGNRVEWSLDGVYSTVIVQGADATTEERPEQIEGNVWDMGSGDQGELELLAAPWRDYAAAYRAVAQPKRQYCWKGIDGADSFTPPYGWTHYGHLPRIYYGAEGGPKWLYRTTVHWLISSRVIAFLDAPALAPGEKLWAWYWAEVPFTVQAGPSGDAYRCYGYEAERTIFDPAFRDTTSWPKPGTADDAVAMGILAERQLRLHKNVRRSGTLSCAGVDFEAFHLLARYSLANLGALTTTTAGATTTPPAPTSSTEGCTDPTCWDRLNLNSVEVLYDFAQERTEISVANTFWMLEDYSELKRRLETNMFVQRELDLSERFYDCLTYQTLGQDLGPEDEPTTGSETTPAEGCVEIGTMDEAEAAYTDTWSLAQGCVKATELTRLAYDHEGDQQLYAFYRTFTYDAFGALLHISAETRVVIDTPEPC